MFHDTTNTGTDPLLWHEAAPGRWERDVDELELFYTTLAKLFEGTGRTFFAITGCISVLLPIDSMAQTETQQGQRIENAFRKAWTQLRYDHPTLSSSVKYDKDRKKCVKVYNTMYGIDEEDEWLSSSFKTVSNGLTGDQFANSDPPVNDHATLFLINPPSFEGDEDLIRRDIVFRCHHSTIDGIGTLILLNNLLAYAASAYRFQDGYHAKLLNGAETENLSPSFRVAASLSRPPTQEQQDHLSKILAFNSSAAAIDSSSTILSLPFRKPPSNPPGPSKHIVSRLSTTETVDILQKCKALGLTPTHAFHAGVVLALRDLQPHSEFARKGRYKNYGLLNLRSHCSPPYNSAKHAASVYHSISIKSLIVDVDIPSSSNTRDEEVLRQEFITIAKDIKTFYHNAQSDPDHNAIVSPYYTTITPQYPEESIEVPPPNAAPTVSISSFGLVDKIIERDNGMFTVCGYGMGPWVASDELGTGMGVYLATWRDQIEVSIGFNAAFRLKEEANGFLDSMKTIIFDALNVSACPE